MTLSGFVLRIERSSIHDGPGLRTVLFLKGCPLRCAWCSTPESQQQAPERGYASHRCTTCGTCVRSCPQGALTTSADSGKIVTDATKCTTCFICVTKCPQRAIKKYGCQMTVQSAVQEIVKDEIFFFHSGGGVTISGGEPLTQPDFVAAVLRECKERGIHTAIETSFHVPFAVIEKVLPWLDVLYVDIKHAEQEQHRQWVGSENSRILDNIKKADESKHPLAIVVRIPLIPGINDTDANLSATAKFCRSLNKLKSIELLPYHRLGIETYKNLGIEYAMGELARPAQAAILERADFLSQQNPGAPVQSGGGFNKA